MALKFNRMFITITDNCDYSCKHCYMSSSPKANKFMLDSVFARSVDLYAENHSGVPVLKISGGDPLNHPNFRDFVSYAVKKIPDVDLGVLTTDNMFKRNREEFANIVRFLQDNNLRYLSFNSDLNFRGKDKGSLQAARELCIELANSGNHFYVVSDFPAETPYFLGSAQDRIPLNQCDTTRKNSCNSFDVTYVNNEPTFPMNVTVNGQLQYCLFGIGKYANVMQDMRKVEELLLDRKIFKTLQQNGGLGRVLDVVDGITKDYDHLPPNCARLQGILEDPLLVKEIEVLL